MGISTLPPPEERPSSGQESLRLARLRASRDRNSISSGRGETGFNPSPRTYQQQEVDNASANAGGFVSPRSPSGGLGIDPNLLRPRGVLSQQYAQHVHFEEQSY